MTGIFHPWRWLPDVRIFHRHRDAEYSNTHSQRILLTVCYLGSLRALLPLTFAARAGDKGRRNLHDPFAFALRAGNLPLFILGKSLKQRKLMLTALGFTLIFVSRHVVLPLESLLTTTAFFAQVLISDQVGKTRNNGDRLRAEELKQKNKFNP